MSEEELVDFEEDVNQEEAKTEEKDVKKYDFSIFKSELR